MPGVGLEVNKLVHLQNVIFLGNFFFLEVHILTTTYQKAFILVPKVVLTLFHGTPGSVPGVGSEVKI